MPKARKLKAKPYKSFRLSKRVKHPKADLPSSYKLMKKSLNLLRSHWKLFGGLILVYMLLTIIVVGFGTGSDIQGLKGEAQAEQIGSLIASLSIFSYLLSTSSGAASEAGSVYQFFLVVIFSLASLWTLRQVQAGQKVSIKQSFYQGMYPLVPFILVLFVIILQLVPLLIGSFLYGVVVQGGIAVEAIEKILWGMISGMLALLSLYMVSSSIFALYIVTLPDMRPMQALRSAREIVRFRRFLVMRKVLALPLILVVMLALIVVPLIIVFAPLAEAVFFILSMTLLLIAHTYIYTLYRELL